MTSPYVCGIDPSLTRTAIVYGTGITEYRVDQFPSKPLGKAVEHRIRRLEGVASSIDRLLETIKPAVALIENYSFGSVNGGEHLGEWGGILRWHILDHVGHLFEVAPGTLKKFATGKGNATKDMIGVHLLNRYGAVLQNNDEYDAFGLYQMALQAAGIAEPQTQAQKEAIATVLGDRQLNLVPAASTPFEPPLF